jgi:osmoprotectant transport system permease protein
MDYLFKQPTIVWKLLVTHLSLTSVALVVAVAIALPLSLCVYYFRGLRSPVLAVLGGLYTIPSLALMILLIPFLGLGQTSVITAMVIYAQVILVRSFLAGLQSIPADLLEASTGLGMNAWQRWWQVQLPLGLPIFLSGLRIATVVVIAIATLGAKFGAGGLGTLLFEGLAQSGRADKIWAGAIAVGGLAIALNTALLLLERTARRTS